MIIFVPFVCRVQCNRVPLTSQVRNLVAQSEFLPLDVYSLCYYKWKLNNKDQQELNNPLFYQPCSQTCSNGVTFIVRILTSCLEVKWRVRLCLSSQTSLLATIFLQVVMSAAKGSKKGLICSHESFSSFALLAHYAYLKMQINVFYSPCRFFFHLPPWTSHFLLKSWKLLLLKVFFSELHHVSFGQEMTAALTAAKWISLM